MTRPGGSKVKKKKEKRRKEKKKERKFSVLVASKFGSYFLQRVKADKKLLRTNLKT